MSKLQHNKPPSRGDGSPMTPASKLGLATIGVLLLVIAGWILWNSWQRTRSLAAQAAAVPAFSPAATPAPPLAGISPAAAAGTQVGDVAPDFTVPTLAGGTFTLSQQGGRPTIIFFMAYWCGTCLPEAQALAQLKQEYGEDMNIIAIDVDPTSTPETLGQFKEAAGNGAYTWAFDTDQQVIQLYQVRTLDTTLILDAKGRIIYRDALVTPYQTLKEALAEAGL